MAVVAKFQVTSVEQFQWAGQKVNLQPVYAGPGADERVTSKEDGAFWEATPNGGLWMTINNPEAAEQFQPGDSFYVTFERANGETSSS